MRVIAETEPGCPSYTSPSDPEGPWRQSTCAPRRGPLDTPRQPVPRGKVPARERAHVNLQRIDFGGRRVWRATHRRQATMGCNCSARVRVSYLNPPSGVDPGLGPEAGACHSGAAPDDRARLGEFNRSSLQRERLTNGGCDGAWC